MRDDLAKAHLAAVVESSFDAIVSKDLNSIVQSWNPAAERMFGWSAEEMIGQSILRLIPDRLKNEEAVIIGKVSRGERLASFETIRQRKDGTLFPVSLTVSPIRDPGGQIIGASKIARDITAAKQSERRVRLLMQEVNHRVKNQYAVILSVIRETMKHAATPAEFEALVRDRIVSLSRSHDLLVATDWVGTSLAQVAEEHLRSFGHESQITVEGPDITLEANAVQALGMAFHELGTNSAKYGALSSDEGTVAIRWTIDAGSPPRVELRWDEQTPASSSDVPSTRKGFGTVVLTRVAPASLGGQARLEREPGRVSWVLSALLTEFTGDGAAAEN